MRDFLFFESATYGKIVLKISLRIGKNSCVIAVDKSARKKVQSKKFYYEVVFLWIRIIFFLLDQNFFLKVYFRCVTKMLVGVFVNILKKLHTGDVRQLKLKIFLHVIIIQLCINCSLKKFKKGVKKNNIFISTIILRMKRIKK